jgi:hypothetical protein
LANCNKGLAVHGTHYDDDLDKYLEKNPVESGRKTYFTERYLIYNAIFTLAETNGELGGNISI